MENSENSKESPLIGIDLGTTNSLVSVFENGKPKLIENPHGTLLTPSVVGILDSGEIIVGDAAKELQTTKPENCASCFKRWMGTDQTMRLAGKDISAIELSSYVLMTLKKDAESYLKGKVEDAVITVPAYFNEHQRKATRFAGEMAGLNVKRIINEPTSAALTYGFHDKDSEKKFMIFDLGGGTFDVTVMELFDGVLEIVSTAGESFLGGEDFSTKIVSWVLKQEGLSFEATEHQHPKLFSRLYQQCEQAKRTLTDGGQAVIRVPNQEGELEADKRYEINADTFKEITEPLIQRIQRPVVKALRDARLSVEDLDEVILVGGATRMGLIRSYIENEFKKQPITGYDPDHVVALGACIQAALIEDQEEVQDIVMTDVCPHTLGMEVMKTFGKREMSGHYLPIIHRNTTIPVSEEEIVSPHHHLQTSLVVSVYQGESRMVKDNLKLGELEINGLPPRKEGEPFPVHVRFSYDVNGLLEVEAYVPSLDKKFSTVIKNNVKALSETEIKKAIEEMQKLKFYPREDAENIKLIHFVERIMTEVAPFQREEISRALDDFESALCARDKTAIDSTRMSLIMCLSRYGYEYSDEDK